MDNMNKAVNKTSPHDELLSGVKFRIIRPLERRKIWLPELEIVFVLRGEGHVSFSDGIVCAFKTEDIFAVNPFELCSVDMTQDTILLSLTLSSDITASLYPEFLRYKIACRSFLASEDNQEHFDIIRRDVAQAFRETYKTDGSTYPRSKITALLEDLTKYFAVEEKKEVIGGGRERIQMAADYILENYKEEITLESLSKHIYLSETYISRSFPRYFGVSFLEYVTQVRLNHAVDDMTGTLSLTEIAYNNGFTSENMMIRAFRKYRGVTPGEYRKQLLQERAELAKGSTETRFVDSFGLNKSDYLNSIFKYATANENIGDSCNSKNLFVDINVGARRTKAQNHFRRVMNGGYARSVIDAEIQSELKRLKKAVGFEFIRVKGLVDDDMMVYRQGLDGEVYFSFNYIDEVIDFILSIGAKPMLEIGHMPSALKSGEGTVFLRPANNFATDKVDEWSRLITLLMRHLLERYGEKALCTWIFVPWISSNYVSSFGVEKYVQIYKASFDAIKSVSANIITCHSFSINGDIEDIYNTLSELKKNECMPEIISTRSYSCCFDEEGGNLPKLITNIEAYNFGVSEDPSYLFNEIKGVKEMLSEHGFDNIPIIIDELNSNIWQRDLCNDTCYKSAWLMKNYLENEDNCNGIAYFSVNDRLDEIFPASDPFHGGFGLFTTQGIPKAHEVAMELLGKMGNCVVKKGDGYYVAYDSERNCFQIYLYNYIHYDTLYRFRHTLNISRCDRYRVFENNNTMNVAIRLVGLPNGNIQKKSYKITREHGSSYDAWVRIGAPQTLNQEEKAFLVHAADPEYRRETIMAEENTPLIINECLKPHEVMLIELTVNK